MGGFAMGRRTEMAFVAPLAIVGAHGCAPEGNRPVRQGRTAARPYTTHLGSGIWRDPTLPNIFNDLFKSSIAGGNHLTVRPHDIAAELQ